MQAGNVTLFVRVGGCDYRCAWCDSLHAVLSENRHTWAAMTPAEIVARLEQLAEPPIWVTLSGGNPAIPEAMPDLIRMLRHRGYRTSMETQGSIHRAWMRELDSLVLSPKPPSSGMTTDWAALHACVHAGAPETSLKVVVGSDEDYAFARSVHGLFPYVPFFVQPCNPHGAANGFDLQTLSDTTRTLMERVANDPAARKWRVIPQLHTLAWGSMKGV
jgi:7-carboxy-7-deazaguanine synthase